MAAGKRPALILLFICIFFLLTNLSVIFGTTYPLIHDQIGSWGFLDQSLLFRASLIRGQLPPFSALYPPLPSIVRSLVQVVLGATPEAAIAGTALISLVLIVSVFAIGVEVYGPSEGLLAAFITAAMPGIFAFSRTLYAEVPLAAMVALTLALMLKSKHFTNPRYTLAFGISLGLGFLTKWTYPLFITGPFVVYAIQAALKRIHLTLENMVWLGRLVLPILLGLALAAAWYVPNMQTLFSHLASTKMRGTPLPAFHFWGFLLGPVFFLAVALAILSIRNWRRMDRNLLLMVLLWVALPYLSFISGGYPLNPRFMAPAVPACALLLAFWIHHMNPRSQGLVRPILVMGGLVQLLALTYLVRVPQLDDPVLFGVPTLDVRDWKMDDILTELSALVKGREMPRILVGSGGPYSGQPLLIMMMLRNNCQDDPAACPFMVADLGASIPAINGSLCSSCLDNSSFFEEQFISSDIVLLERGEEGIWLAISKTARASFTTKEDRESVIGPAMEGWQAASPLFDPIASFPLPTGNELALYVRRAHSELLLRRERLLDADSALQFVPDGSGKTYGSSSGEEILFQIPLSEPSLRVEENATTVLIPPLLRKILPSSRLQGHAYLVITFVDPPPEGFDVLINDKPSASVSPHDSSIRLFSAVMVPLPQLRSHEELHVVRIVPHNISNEGREILTVQVVCPGEEDCVA